MANTHRIFISHSWQRHNVLEKLRSMLENRGFFNIEFSEVSREEPIQSENAYYIKRRLAERIAGSCCVLGLAGVYASHSDWMEWELAKAVALDIPIIGVVPRGQERISTRVSSRSVIDVRWNTESIVKAIRDHSK